MTLPPPPVPTPDPPRPNRTALWITLGVVGGVLLLALIGVVIVAATTLVTKPAPPTASNAPSGAVDITGTPVTLEGSTVTSNCFTFTLPEGYMMNPSSTDCSTEIRVDPGDGSTGDSLGSYRIAAQINVTSDTFLDWAEGALNGTPITETKSITVDGAEATVAYFESGGFIQSITYVPLGATAFVTADDPIGGYIILGPGVDVSPTETILGSFHRQ